MNSHVLATGEEIRAIFERSTALLEKIEDDDDDGFEDDDGGRARRAEMNRSLGLVIEALRFCAAAADALRDPSLGDVVIRALRCLEPYESYAEGHHDVAASALSALLGAGLKVDKQVRRLAESEHPRWREAVARGLPPHGDAERALLEKLLHDPVAAVRKAARKNLETIGETPWWSGKWKSDPAARLLPAEVEACGPALRRVSELLDLPPYSLFGKDRSNFTELCEQMAKLPDELAVEATEQLCRAAERYDIEVLGPLLVPVFERPGGPDMLDRLVEYWGRRDDGLLHREALAKLAASTSRETRLAVCKRCIARVVAAPRKERHELRASPAWLAGSIAGEAWPPDEDITPVLDALLSVEPGEGDPHDHDYACSELADALAVEGVDPTPVLDRLVEARVAGYPGAWKPLAHDADVLLSRAPADVLRRTAERALHAEDDKTVTWALELLLGPAHRPETDGPPLERAAAFAADPRLRKVILASSSLAVRALPVLRADLRQGGLSYEEGVQVLEAISTLYGGLAVSRGIRRIYTAMITPENGEPDIEAERIAARAEVAAFLGPPELQGPPTEAEREAVRRARASAPEALRERAALWLRSLSDGPWTADERAVFDDYLAQFRAGAVDDIQYSLGHSIAVKPEVELLPVLDEVVARATREVRPLLQRVRTQTYQALGVPRSPSASAAKSEDGDDDELPGGEWDDDEDDEDDE